MADDLVEVSIETDDPDFFKALQDPKGLFSILAESMQKIMTVYKEQAEIYAPESEANKPGRVDREGKPMGYYERGRGWWYPLVTHNTLQGELPILGIHTKAPKTLGSTALLAKGIPVVTGYRLVPNSEKMHDQWAIDVIQTENEVVGVLSNTASYSGYVQGFSQTRLHQSRDWQTVMQSWQAQQVQDYILEETLNAVSIYYHLGA